MSKNALCTTRYAMSDKTKENFWSLLNSPSLNAFFSSFSLVSLFAFSSSISRKRHRRKLAQQFQINALNLLSSFCSRSKLTRSHREKFSFDLKRDEKNRTSELAGVQNASDLVSFHIKLLLSWKRSNRKSCVDANSVSSVRTNRVPHLCARVLHWIDEF